MFDRYNLKLTNVIKSTKNNDVFLTEISFQELKELINSGTIEIDLSKEVPFISLKDEDSIFLNIDKDLIFYDNNARELTIKGKFSVMEGIIRIITFMNYYPNESGKVYLRISCYDTIGAINLLMNVDKKIPINEESIKVIASKIKMNHELMEEINSWVERNGGDGYHRIIGLVNSCKALGETDEEIIKMLRKM